MHVPWRQSIPLTCSTNPSADRKVLSLVFTCLPWWTAYSPLINYALVLGAWIISFPWKLFGLRPLTFISAHPTPDQEYNWDGLLLWSGEPQNYLSQPPKRPRPKATSSPIWIKISNSWITTIRDAFTNLLLNRGFTYKIGKYRRFALCWRQHGRFLLHAYRRHVGASYFHPPRAEARSNRSILFMLYKPNAVSGVLWCECVSTIHAQWIPTKVSFHPLSSTWKRMRYIKKIYEIKNACRRTIVEQRSKCYTIHRQLFNVVSKTPLNKTMITKSG
jgi:hypothetical protein